MFGKRKTPPGSPPEAEQDVAPEKAVTEAGGNRGGEASFPWSDDPSSTACNLAAGNLANNLPSRLTIDGGIHAETYMAASGAIAGFASQCSLFATADAATFDSLMKITAKNGRTYFFGDPLNALIFPEGETPGGGQIWLNAAGAACALGLPESNLPDIESMFAHVSANIGGEREGFPSTPQEHQPHLPAQELLKLLWPFVAELFGANFDEFHKQFGPVPGKWWGPIASHMVSRPIHDVKDVLAPSHAVRILVESAIYASKLDRAYLEAA